MTQRASWDPTDFLAGLGDFTDELREKAVLAVQDAAEYVLGEAVDVVPLDTGDLSNSGRVTMDRENVRGIISFDTPYAVEQHENMAIPHSPGRHAKYLEIPLIGGVNEIRAIIERRMSS